MRELWNIWSERISDLLFGRTARTAQSASPTLQLYATAADTRHLTSDELDSRDGSSGMWSCYVFSLLVVACEQKIEANNVALTGWSS